HLLAAALMAEIAIGEPHTGDRAAEAAVVPLVEIEAGLERNALDRRAHALAADLQCVAGEAKMADRPGAGEPDRAGGPESVKDAAGAAGAVETGEGEDLAGNEPARLIRRHHPGERGCDHRTGRDGSQHQTRKHPFNSNFTISGGAEVSLPAAYHTNRGEIE